MAFRKYGGSILVPQFLEPK